ncbi:MAG: hypothetical protein EA397_19095 [Deltaproteobacteria bacterium]|nr:MAG: hypothetical protein EA397_19095 [Deltaproteobacteria bacterium]
MEQRPRRERLLQARCWPAGSSGCRPGHLPGSIPQGRCPHQPGPRVGSRAPRAARMNGSTRNIKVYTRTTPAGLRNEAQCSLRTGREGAARPSQRSSCCSNATAIHAAELTWPAQAGCFEWIDLPNFDLAGCWSHGRRGFKKAISQADEAHLFLADIDELFAIERQAKEEADGCEAALLDLRTTLRKERSREIVERLYQRCEESSRLSGTALAMAVPIA